MAVFLIANLKITDESWIPEYAAKVHDIQARKAGSVSRFYAIDDTDAEGSIPDLAGTGS